MKIKFDKILFRINLNCNFAAKENLVQRKSITLKFQNNNNNEI